MDIWSVALMGVPSSNVFLIIKFLGNRLNFNLTKISTLVFLFPGYKSHNLLTRLKMYNTMKKHGGREAKISMELHCGTRIHAAGRAINQFSSQGSKYYKYGYFTREKLTKNRLVQLNKDLRFKNEVVTYSPWYTLWHNKVRTCSVSVRNTHLSNYFKTLDKGPSA